MWKLQLLQLSLTSYLFFLIIAILVGAKWYTTGVWFAFSWWLVMLSNFPCAYWLSVYKICMFLPILWVVFWLSWWRPFRYKTFHFWQNLSFFFLYFEGNFTVISNKVLSNTRSQKIILMFSPKCFIVLQLTLRSTSILT